MSEEIKKEESDKKVIKPNPENHSPMNSTCSKCGRVYCDHENKY